MKNGFILLITPIGTRFEPYLERVLRCFRESKGFAKMHSKSEL